MSRDITLNYDLSAIENADIADTTRTKYKREITKYLDAGHKIGDYKTLTSYAAGLTKSRRAFLKAAIRLVTKDHENFLKSTATSENIDQVNAALHRLDAIKDAIKVDKQKGKKVHTWLKAEEVKDMMNATKTNDDDLTYLRDRVILGLAVGAGLRREEVVNAKFGDLDVIPNGKGDRDAIHVTGKGAKQRTIPINPILAQYIEDWRQHIDGKPDELIARSLGRSKELGDSMSAVGMFKLVRKYGEMIGKPKLAPHDLRRTFAMIGRVNGVPIEQLSVLLGHASVETTKRYLDLKVDLDKTASDFIPL